jgi:hypothetical protein
MKKLEQALNKAFNKLAKKDQNKPRLVKCLKCRAFYSIGLGAVHSCK